MEEIDSGESLNLGKQAWLNISKNWVVEEIDSGGAPSFGRIIMAKY